MFLAGAIFDYAQFGKDCARTFGYWDIQFVIKPSAVSPYADIGYEESCILKMRKSDGTEKQWEEIEVPFSPNFPNLLRNKEIWKDQDASRMIHAAFEIFKNNPHDITFSGCRFGAMKIDDLPENKIKEIINKEEIWLSRNGSGNNFTALNAFKKYDFSSLNLRTEPEKSDIMRILARHMDRQELHDERLIASSGMSFGQAAFYPQGHVDFEDSLFLKDREVDFSNVRFGNGGNINFDFATFSNSGYVDFSGKFGNGGNVDFFRTWFGNGDFVNFNSRFENGRTVSFSEARLNNNGSVGFSKAIFCNGKNVSLDRVKFSNEVNVSFASAMFSNGGDVDISCSTFSNLEHVDFFGASFSNKGELSLSQIIWVNGGNLDLRFKELRESLPVKFDECLFLSVGDIYFKEARFPEKGSLMFQRCYFGRTIKVDFTGAFFRHTSFEGGEISWLKRKSEPELVLRERLGEKYDSLPKKAKERLGTGVTPVFEEGVEVLWKDLTTESAKNLTLRRVNLSHSLFDGMTLSHIQLNAPRWYEEEDGRRYLYEEKKLREKKEISKFDLENIKDQYTQLKNNLEKQGNYVNAGYFHYAEQEIRREIAEIEGKTRTFNYLLTGCYRWLSGYGEQPERAVKVTLSILLSFSLILAAISINSSPVVVFKELGGWGFLVKCVAKLFGAIVEILTPFSWKKSESLRETFSAAHGLSLLRLLSLVIFQFIVLAIQVPLLVLAVRRRFKR